jgi:catechol 2,3-dioxygenase-like lactoylglutathione lyase family enzyme
MEMRIELIAVPVTDVDRARDFYASLGWNVDHDTVVDESTRFVQITPPGSACSIAFGEGIADTAPGSLRGIQLVIKDADAALALLQQKGADADPAVDDQPWGRFVHFRDPDGNAYTLQQLPEWSPSYANAPQS